MARRIARSTKLQTASSAALLAELSQMADRPLTWRERFGARLDDLVGVFSPRRGRQRAIDRARMFGADVAFGAASKDRQLADWLPMSGPPDAFLETELGTLRDRARDLERNDPHGHALVDVKVDSVVGTGLQPQARATPDETGLSPDQVAEWNAACDQTFRAWARDQADSTGQSAFWQLQRLCYRGHMTDGEFLVHPIAVDVDPANGRTMPIALEVVSPERLGTPDAIASKDIPKELLARIRNGIEIGARGQPLAYWIADGNPDDRLHYPTLAWERVRRWRAGRLNLLHVFRRDAAEQTRGIPAITATMRSFRQLSRYMEAELVGARVAACIALYVKRTSLEDDPSLIDDSSTGEPRKLLRMEPGTIEYLDQGEEIQQVVPQRPGAAFDPFVIRILTAIAASSGMPVQMLLRDWSRSNYSSARTSLLEARRGFKVDQAALASGFCDPVRSLVLWVAYTSGLLPLIPNAAELWPKLTRCVWIAPPWGWVDPVKEIESSETAIAAGLSTLSDEAQSSGVPWEDVLEQRARELSRIAEIEDRHGLPRGSLVPGSLKGGAEAPNPAPEPAPQDPNQ